MIYPAAVFARREEDGADEDDEGIVEVEACKCIVTHLFLCYMHADELK
jgi:hypothetical protein